MKISQTSYLERTLERHGKIVSLPSTVEISTRNGIISQKNEAERAQMSHCPYRKIFGSFLCPSERTSLNICYAVRTLFRQTNNPYVEDWNAEKRVLRYLSRTRYQGISIRRTENHDSLFDQLISFSDANCAGERSNKIPKTGYIVYLNGGISTCDSLKL